MRVVSQDGTTDVPYEYVSVSLNPKHRNDVIAYPSAFTQHNGYWKLATYSTEEKAIKAMEMLRGAYVELPILFQNVDMNESVVDKLKEWKRDGIVLFHDNAEAKIEQVNNAIFQFPKDEEIEV